MAWKLVVVAAPDQGRSFEVPDADALLLGRSKATRGRSDRRTRRNSLDNIRSFAYC